MIDKNLALQTDRLMIRFMREEDAKELHQAKNESWDALFPWLIWTQKPLNELTLEDDIEQCKARVKWIEEKTALTFCAFNNSSNKLIGIAMLQDCDWEARTFTLGFWVRSSQTKRGYAKEMCREICSYAFKDLKASEILSHHAQGNKASAAVLKKIGFNQIEHKDLTNKTAADFSDLLTLYSKTEI